MDQVSNKAKYLKILLILLIFVFSKWLQDCQSRIGYERRQDNQVFYVVQVESILGKLPGLPKDPIGDTDTISFSIRQHVGDFVSAAFNNRGGSGNGSRW
jgi:hypothetical protein